MEYIFELTNTGTEMLLYVKVYDDVWSVWVWSCIDGVSFVSYNIFQHRLQAVTKLSSYCEYYKYVEVY